MGQSSNALFDFTQNQFVYLQSAVNLIGPVLALTLLSALAGAIASAYSGPGKYPGFYVKLRLTENYAKRVG